ncbi:MAG: ABC transporter permease, partial [Acidobacteria bacterium]|nr:ABC transporter permease [Acidobacteriota bacterium]
MSDLERWLYKLPLRLRSLIHRRHVEQELDEELQYHVERQIEQEVAKGMDPREARYLAMRRLGGIAQRKEECRDARGVSFIEHAIQDLGYGIRVLRKNPGFAFAVIATLALGVGATTAVFSVVYGVVLRPLPYPQQGQLVTIGHAEDWISVGVANYLDWRAQNTVFEEVGITKLVQNFNITGDGEPERVLGGRSTAGVFRVLRVSPILGRVFTDEDGPVEDKVVLSYGLWKRRYAGDPAILGKKIQLNSKPYTVLGVMPAEFQYRNREFALWTPLMVDPNEARTAYDYACIARLRNGITLAQAQAQLLEIQSRIRSAHPLTAKGIYISPMLDSVAGNVRTPLYFLMAAVLCLLLIGCANLTNLLVARSMTRSQELVIRAALGADKGRLILQSIMEVVPLVVLGGMCGLLLAQWMLSLLVPLLPANMPRLEAIRMDWQVLAFAIVVLFATAIGTGAWPAFQVRRWNINQTLQASGRRTGLGRGASRLRSVLVVAQIATVVVLMVVSGLLIRSFAALRNVDPGFRSDNILSVHFALSEQYGTNPKFGQYLRRILERVSAIPGIVSVGMVNRIPLSGQNQTGTLYFEGTALSQDPAGTLGTVNLDWRVATPDYFRTLGIPLIEGRFFEESDTADRPRVGIVDERLARHVWPNQSAIGKRFRFGGQEAWYEVVGVVGHIRHDKLGIDERLQVYWSYHQRAQPRMALAVRTNQDPQLFAASVIAAIHEVDPEQPVYEVRSMDEVVERSLSQEWLNTMLLSLFASISLVLATVGVYGVLSYSVSLRAREIGIRMALGSRRSSVIWMVLRQGGLLAGLGTLIGIAGSLAVGRVLNTLLYEIKSTDVLSFCFASLVLFLVAIVASFIPARRAAS